MAAAVSANLGYDPGSNLTSLALAPNSLELANLGGRGSLGFNTAQNQAVSQQQSNSFIPDYSQTPILEQIAQYAGNMAPQVYQWGMQQYANNQGNINSLMRNALSYASPQRQAVDVGQAEAGVQQGAEAGRQSAISDLQSYGIDPSAGRYAALDQASRVQSGAAAAGAGNQQRMADVATGNAMQNQAISSSLQNVAQGVATTNAANDFAKTGMSLPYSPLGTSSSGASASSGSSFGVTAGAGGGGGGSSNLYPTAYGGAIARGNFSSSSTPPQSFQYQAGGPVGYQPGGDVSYADSPSRGAQTDDVNANLNAGEFVIPKDVAAWKGQEFFYKLMAQARKMRATSGGQAPAVGYGAT